MERFTQNTSAKKRVPLKNLLLSILIFTVVLLLFLYALNAMSEKTVKEQEQTLLDALNRSVVQCYATEGYYPESLDYLKKHYGISYEEALFFVDYRPRGENILPDITVICKK